MSTTNYYGNLVKKKCIQNSDPGKILELILQLNENQCSALQIKTNIYLMEETQCDVVFQIIVNIERMEAFIEVVNDTVLERKMKVCVTPKLKEILKSSVEYVDLLMNFAPDVRDIVVPFYTDPNNRSPLIRNLHQEDEESSVPVEKVQVTMLSIADTPFSTVICVVAPRIHEDHVAITIHELFLFIWPTISKVINLEYEIMLKQKNQLLLRVAKRLFNHVTSLENLLQIAKEQAKILTKSQHCLLRLVDVEKMELVEPAYPQRKTLAEETNERRFPLTAGLAGYVIQSGCLINLREPKKHKCFKANIDSIAGVDCDNLLVFPLRDRSGINGVGHLINRHHYSYYDSVDEEMALAFSVYCGMAISYSIMYRKLQEDNVRNRMINDVVLYHLKITDAEVQKILKCPGFHSHPQLSDFKFNPRVLPYKEYSCYFIRMIKDRRLNIKFNIKEEKLVAFVLRVKKGYRNVPYHNWIHAFNTTHWAYAACVNFKLVYYEFFTELQELMYLISALTHDLDHRGATNSYQILGQTSLAALYSSEGSVMERHHLTQAMCILNTEGCDILENLPRHDYDKAILMLKDFIVATDLTNFVKNYADYKVIAYDYQRQNRAHVAALQAIMITAASLSGQLKDWPYVKKHVVATMKEYVYKSPQCELARNIMNNESIYIPDLQIEFLNTFCIPVYELLDFIIPKAEEYQFVKHLDQHIQKWEDSKLVFQTVPPSEGLELLTNPDLDTMIEQALLERQRRLEEEEEEEETAEQK